MCLIDDGNFWEASLKMVTSLEVFKKEFLVVNNV